MSSQLKLNLLEILLLKPYLTLKSLFIDNKIPIIIYDYKTKELFFSNKSYN